MYLKCNHCHFEGDVEPREERQGNYYLPCPVCRVVKIVAAGEPVCDFCRGQPIVATYVVQAFELHHLKNFLKRDRKMAACADCREDIQMLRRDVAWTEHALGHIVYRGAEHLELTGYARTSWRKLMQPLWAEVIRNITEGPNEVEP